MSLKEIVINSYGRPRSGWRFLIFMLLFAVVLIPSSMVVHLILTNLPIGYGPGTLLFHIVNFGVQFVLAAGIGWLCARVLEGLPFRALGLAFTRNWLKDLGLGFVTGGATLVLAVASAMIFGALSFRFNESRGSSAIVLTLAVSSIVFAVGAAFEEAFCRGYILQTFVRSEWAWPAIFFTSLLFASGHLWNPNVNPIAIANTLLAGIWFGVAYMKTRTLWLPFGMHFMWNWVQGSIFGIEVSGITNISTAPLLLETDHGPAWLTGGGYGIEGGILCMIALIISTIVIHFLPFLKPTEDMLELTSREKPVNPNLA
jgi:uncharacterized protein